MAIFSCRMIDGRKAALTFQDLGETVFEGRKVYEATLAVTVGNGTKPVSAMSRVCIADAQASGDALRFRLAQDKATMEGLGIDVESVFA